MKKGTVKLKTKSGTSEDVSKIEKQRLLNTALNCDPVDVVSLQNLALLKGGLLNDEIRLKVWPKLLNINLYNYEHVKYDIKQHKDYNQVILDVNRSMRRFPEKMEKTEREILQTQLTEIILLVLIRNPELNYYQGYHDICVTFLLICGKKNAELLVEKLSTLHLRDFMDPTMDKTRHILNYLNPIIHKVDTKLGKYLDDAEVGTIFALSWLITWYGHVITNTRTVRRLYDLFLASHPLMPIYVAAAIVLFRADEIYSVDCDMPSVHHLLSNIPNCLPWEEIICSAVELFKQYPPVSLANDAALFYDKSLSILRYKDFELAARNQRPDFILKTQKQVAKIEPKYQPLSNLTNYINRMNIAKNSVKKRGTKWAFYALTGAAGAAAIALTNTAVEWVPELMSAYLS